jgi:amidase
MDLIAMTAAEVVDLLARRAVSTAELLDALEARHAAVDGAVGALPTTCFDRARAAPVADGPLRGLPVAIKDLSAVRGVRTTWGSPIYADFTPDWSDHVVERIEARGGVIYAKSNTPEFGAGAQTFNEVFPPTRNPWNLSKSAAGSSGGAAAALKSGTAWLAQGSDLGGSLRNPASFCGVVGLRPSPFRVPHGPAGDPFSPLSVDGPMARTVEDCALFLDALSGREAREPVSLDAPDRPFRDWARAAARPRRVAFSPDLGGITPVDPEVAAICARAARRFEGLGATVEVACPDLSDAPECFQILRALGFATAHADHYARHRDKLKPEVIWNIEKGMALTGERIGWALRARAQIVARARAFFGTYDLLLCPATIVAPFDVTVRWPDACAGVALPTYIDWLRIVSAITLTACPALSLPCGFTAAGLPVGLQMVGGPLGEGPLLGHAAALEADLGLDPAPIDPRPGDE